LQGKGINNGGAAAQVAWLGIARSTWMGSNASKLWEEANARLGSRRIIYVVIENPAESPEEPEEKPPGKPALRVIGFTLFKGRVAVGFPVLSLHGNKAPDPNQETSSGLSAYFTPSEVQSPGGITGYLPELSLGGGVAVFPAKDLSSLWITVGVWSVSMPFYLAPNLKIDTLPFLKNNQLVNPFPWGQPSSGPPKWFVGAAAGAVFDAANFVRPGISNSYKASRAR
jgi:hypothetical protein